MKTKLTLSIEASVIELAKQYAKESGDSLSSIFENHLKFVTHSNKKTDTDEVVLSPRIQRLAGSAKLTDDRDPKDIIMEEKAKKYFK